jgi:signal transduction histidine kinase
MTYGWRMRVSARAGDLLLTAAVATAVTVAIAAQTEEGARDPGVVAYAIGLAMALPVLARRRHPVAALGATIVLLQLYYSLRYPAIAYAVPLTVPVFAVAAAGRLPLALAAIALFTSLGLGWRILGEGERVIDVIAVGSLVEACALVASAMLGDAVRARRGWAAETARRVALAEQAAQEGERLRIARDLHDVLGHHISLINVQAGVALYLMDDDPEQARSALTAIKQSSRDLLREMRSTLGVLRGVDEEPPHQPVAGLARLDELVEATRAAGLPVSVEIGGEPRELPPSVDTAAYRIIQEALTNTRKHAGPAQASVLLTYTEDGITMRIDDDGSGPAGRSDGGDGLPGMRERAAALGGTLRAGPRPGGGFRVDAHLLTTGGGGH